MICTVVVMEGFIPFGIDPELKALEGHNSFISDLRDINISSHSA